MPSRVSAKSSLRTGMTTAPASEAFRYSRLAEALSDLAGRPLVQFCVGSGLRLDFDRQPYYELTIEAPLEWKSPGSPGERFEATSVDALKKVRALLFQRLAKAVVRDAVLRLEFESRDVVVVQPAPAHEAWQLQSDDDLLVVSMPGGELSVSQLRTPK